MSSPRFVRYFLGLTAAFAVCAAVPETPAEAAPIKVPPGWAIVNDDTVRYFVFDESLGKVVRKDLVESRTTGSATERRNETTYEARENLAARQSERFERTSILVNPTDRRLAGRFLKTYQIWRNDKLKVVTTTIPYTDYLVTDYEKRTRTTLSNTYAVTTLYSWTDPFTGEPMSREVRKVEPPVTEYSYSAWGPAQDRKKIGDGATSSEASQVVESKNEDRLIGTSLAPPNANVDATGAFQGKHVQALAADAGKGGATARSASAQAAFSMAGTDKARSRGGFASASEDDLFAVATRGVVLYDEEGAKAWKLTAARGALLFLPFDGGGFLREADGVAVARGLRPGTAARGGRIQIKTFSIGANNRVSLTGDFRNPVLGGKGKGSAFLISR